MSRFPEDKPVRRLPSKLAPVIFAGLLSAIMVSIVSAVVLHRHRGFDPLFFRLWWDGFLSAWPIAFPTVLLVAPVVRNIVGRLTMLPN